MLIFVISTFSYVKYNFFIKNKNKCSKQKKALVVFRSQLPKENSLLEEEETGKITLKMESNKELEDEELPYKFQKKEWFLNTEIKDPNSQNSLLKKAQKEIQLEIEEEIELNQDFSSDEFDESYALFSKVSRDTPDQVLRYCFNSETTPLYYSDYNRFQDNGGTCKLCGSKRIFELQLSNSILSYLKPIIGYDWGVVGVYSCENSCKSELGFVEEKLEIQFSPDEIDSITMQKKHARLIREFEKDMMAGNLENVEEEGMQEFEKVSKEENETKADLKKKVEVIKSQYNEEKKKGLFDDVDEEDDDMDWS